MHTAVEQEEQQLEEVFGDSMEDPVELVEEGEPRTVPEEKEEQGGGEQERMAGSPHRSQARVEGRLAGRMVRWREGVARWGARLARRMKRTICIG